MLIQIPKLLAAEQAGQFHDSLMQADWADGRGTAGYLSTRVKNNAQLPELHPLALQLGRKILDALEHNARFHSAALPLKVVPPLFNRYAGGQAYGSHVDGGIRPVAGSSERVRTDLSATLFLSDPADYDGGELTIEDNFGHRSVKLQAGDLVLYPSTSVHRVMPVTRGVRLASFFWIQSMVRDNEQRALLYELDSVVQKLGGAGATQHDEALRLAGVYHNLLRFWADS
ncbi:MAG TPA: Fe2+-dependent dioxygenase [Rhizomicrobium sp.]|jgi:PKHD-type hydroxylase|nr:Fe2+-dependent dioxygenase [Rhizomicrobium sp.]